MRKTLVKPPFELCECILQLLLIRLNDYEPMYFLSGNCPNPKCICPKSHMRYKIQIYKITSLWGKPCLATFWTPRVYRTAAPHCRTHQVPTYPWHFPPSPPSKRFSFSKPDLPYSGLRNPSTQTFSESPWCQLSKFGRKYKFKDNYKDNDKDKDGERLTEALTVCYIFGILMTQAF